MSLSDLITQWLAEHHPEVKIEHSRASIPIVSEYLEKHETGDVWYVFAIKDNELHLFNPAQREFGPVLSAGAPNFFEQLDNVIKFYKSYVP